VQPATWQAFWQTAVEDCPAAQVAQALAMSVGAVYTAKSRVLERIKQEIARLQDS
jgi:RNA polymerase sigma-70 factor (ECF subfamily)